MPSETVSEQQALPAPGRAAAADTAAPGGPAAGLRVVDLRTGRGCTAGPDADERIAVGLGPVPDGARDAARSLDLTLVPAGTETGPEQVGVADPGAALDTLRAAVAARPMAATVLTGLLRWTGDLTVAAALDAESAVYSMLLGGAEFAAWLRAGPDRTPPPSVADPVLVSRRDDELRLTLNRPERRNAYGRQLRDALVAGLDVALMDPTVSRVVIDGAGPAFCSGGDLGEFGTTPDLATAHFVRTRGGAARPVHALRDRTEVYLHGACVGAGIEIPAFAGRVTAAPGTTVRLPELGMGLIPGAGGTVGISRRIGRWRTLYLSLTGAELELATLLAWGLVDGVGGPGAE